METVKDTLKDLNPWWDDPEWHKKDLDIDIVLRSGIERRVRYRFRNKWVSPLLTSENAWGIRVIRGPRRIGKTTLMKLLIKDAIELGLNPKSIVYISLDNVDLKEAVEKGRISLRKMLRELIMKRLEKYGRALIIIDEATFYDKWAITIKNLVDEHVIGPKTLVLVTGSYSLELSQAKRELEGRMGVLNGDDIGQRFLYPMRFVEFIENVAQEVNEFLKNNDYYGYPGSLTKLGTRLRIFEELATPGNTKVFKFFEQAYDEIGSLTIGHLEEAHFYTGGFPKAIYSYIVNQQVPDENYVSFYELLVQDAERFRLSPHILRELIRQKLVSCSSFETTLSNLQIHTRSTKGGLKNLKIEDTEKYLHYLTEGSRVLLCLKALNPTSANPTEPITHNITRPFKLIYLDPLMFHSLYWVSRGVKTNIYQVAKKSVRESMLSINEKRNLFSSLYESIVCSHVVRIPVLKYGVYVENYGRGINNKEYADCVAWYFDNKASRYRIVPVEVTTARYIDEENIIEKAKLISNYLNSRLIVASRDKMMVISKGNAEAIVIPAALLLLLI